MAQYAGVDISYCQPNIDYKALKAGKIGGKAVKFAMIRTSYGCSKDTLLDKHYKGCKEAGLYVGAYHWLRAQNIAQAKQEAKWLIKLLAGYEWDYPIALDFEDEKLFALNLSKERYSAIIDAFMAELKAANYYVMLYTNPDSIRNRITAETLKKYDLWLAHWTHGAAPLSAGQKMWQYASYGTAEDVEDGNATDIGTVAGANGPIDVDWAYVGYAKLIRELGKNKPVKSYVVTASKTVTEDKLSETKKLLTSNGFTVNQIEI